MPFKSKAQQRYLESSSSPLTSAQKKEFEGATNFSKLPERMGKHLKQHTKKPGSAMVRKAAKMCSECK